MRVDLLVITVSVVIVFSNQTFADSLLDPFAYCVDRSPNSYVKQHECYRESIYDFKEDAAKHCMNLIGSTAEMYGDLNQQDRKTVSHCARRIMKSFEIVHETVRWPRDYEESYRLAKQSHHESFRIYQTCLVGTKWETITFRNSRRIAFCLYEEVVAAISSGLARDLNKFKFIRSDGLMLGMLKESVFKDQRSTSLSSVEAVERAPSFLLPDPDFPD